MLNVMAINKTAAVKIMNYNNNHWCNLKGEM